MIATKQIVNALIHRQPFWTIVLDLIGMVMLAAGCWLVHPAAGLIVGGVELILLGVYIELEHSKLGR